MELLGRRSLGVSLLLHGALLVGLWGLGLHPGREPSKRVATVVRGPTASWAAPPFSHEEPERPPLPQLEPPPDPPVPDTFDESVLLPEEPATVESREIVWDALPVRPDIPSVRIRRTTAEPIEKPTHPSPRTPEPLSKATSEESLAPPPAEEILDGLELVISAPPPEYPRSAVRARHEGNVVLLAHIGVDGSVLDCTLEQSSGHRLLDEAARHALLSWRFKPRIRRGVPTPFRARVPFQFVLARSNGSWR